MNYGRFFVLDHDTSRLNQGITVFNYHGARAYEGKFNGKTPKFPIYLTITKEVIEFRVHYYYENSNDSNKDTNTGKSNRGRHLHNVILSLPLSANIEVKDGLTTALSEAYKTNFPLKRIVEEEDKTSYLYDIIERSTANRNSIGLGYADLKVFNSFDDDGNLSYESESQYKKIYTFIRKLILDFLFDLEHTKVFQNSPHYEYTSIKLHENYFFSALANKCMFYYNRELIIKKEKLFADKHKKQCQNYDKTTHSNLLMFYANHLFKAEIEWTKCIRNQKADDVFQDSKGWFSDPEREMNGVYGRRSSLEKTAYKLISKKGQENAAVKKSFGHSSKWYVKRYSFLNAPFPRFRWKKFYIPSAITLLFVISVISFCASAIILSLPNLTGKLNFSWLPLAYSISLGAIALLMVLSFMILLKHRFFKGISPMRYFWGVHILLPRLLIAIVAAWVSIIFSTDILSFSDPAANSGNSAVKNLQYLIVNQGDRLLVFIGAVCLCIALFVYYQISKYNPYGKVSSKIMRTVFFCCIAFLYSYLIGKLLSILFLPAEFNLLYATREMLTPLLQSFFLFTFFAMFIGIFIQLTFDEKPMTESL